MHYYSYFMNPITYGSKFEWYNRHFLTSYNSGRTDNVLIIKALRMFKKILVSLLAVLNLTFNQIDNIRYAIP